MPRRKATESFGNVEITFAAYITWCVDYPPNVITSRLVSFYNLISRRVQVDEEGTGGVDQSDCNIAFTSNCSVLIAHNLKEQLGT